MDEDATKNLYPYLDVAGYNYYEDRYDVLHELHPERPLLGTETRADRIVHTMEYARKHPYLIGDFIWTLQDHIGEANCSNVHYGELELQEGKPAGMQGKDYPWYLNYGGVVDLLGDVLPSIHKFELAWGTKKGIFLGVSAADPRRDRPGTFRLQVDGYGFRLDLRGLRGEEDLH